MRYKDLLEMFEYEKKTCSETYRYLLLEIKSIKNIMNIENLEEIFYICHKEDTMTVTLLIMGENPQVLTLENYRDIINDIDDLFTDDVDLKIEIHKNTSHEVINIYSPLVFLSYLSDCDIEDLLNIFSSLLNNKKYLVFNTMDDVSYFYTKSIYFGDIYNFDYKEVLTSFNRIHKLNYSLEQCQFNAKVNLYLLPDDFHVVYKQENLTIFIDMMKRIELVLSLIYISDYSTIQHNQYTFQISSKNGTLNLQNCSLNQNTYIKLYYWIYETENYYEKLLLTKNMISISLLNINDCNQSTMENILANYKLLQTKNIDKYLEMKSNIAQNITENNKVLLEQISSVVTVVIKNIEAFLTFIFTVFIINIVSSRDISDIFTDDIIFIMYILLFASLVVLIFECLESFFYMKKVKKAYKTLKANYKDLFKSETENLFDYDKEFNDAYNDSKKKIIIICIVWLIVIGILSFVINKYLQ